MPRAYGKLQCDYYPDLPQAAIVAGDRQKNLHPREPEPGSKSLLLQIELESALGAFIAPFFECSAKASKARGFFRLNSKF